MRLEDDAGPEARVAFLLALRAKGLRDTTVLRAFETVQRSRFVPRRFADLALRDVALPIPCGQSMLAPSVMAQIVVALDVRPEHRVLEVGSGSGFGTTILASLAAEVVGIERYRSLVIEARARLQASGVGNASIIHGDGRRGVPDKGPFDRVLIEGSFDVFPVALASQVSPTGRILGVQRDERGSHLVRFARSSMREWSREIVMPLALPPLMEGIAKAL